jgi:hypothetical protein
MQDVADIARALTDAAVVHLSAILLLLAGSAVALGGLVASGIAWLCCVERRSHLHVSRRHAPTSRPR